MRNGFLFASICVLGGCIVGDEGGGPDDELEVDPFAATARFTVAQHNVEKKQAPIDHAVDSGADAITLQEVCPGELATLTSKVHAKGWTIASQEVPHATCENSTNPSVVAIWTGGSNGVTSPIAQLGDTANVPGQAACISFPFKKVTTHVCSVKLISTANPDGEAEKIRVTQTRDLKRLANTWGKDFGVIAGDFNDNPDQPSINALYVPQIGGNGDFTEYNRGNGNTRDGQPTAHATGDNGPYSKKIDYVFFSSNRVPINNGPAVTITPDGSDHDMLVSSAMMSKR